MSGSLYPEGMPPAPPRRLPPSLPYRLLIVVLGSLVAVFIGSFVLRAGDRTTIEVGTDKELEKALERVTGGETILLQPGRYGFHYLRKPYASPVTVRGIDRGGVQVQGFSTVAD